jgi:hypothetical protein
MGKGKEGVRDVPCKTMSHAAPESADAQSPQGKGEAMVGEVGRIDSGRFEQGKESGSFSLSL